MNPYLAASLNGLFKKLELSESIDSYRVFHGRGRCFAGLEWLTVEFYQPVLVFVIYQEPEDGFVENLRQFLLPHIKPSLQAVLLQWRCRMGSPAEVLLGVLPEEVFAKRGGLRFGLHLGSQQNHGYFLDMEAGRQWVEQNADGKRILNLFAYTCAFSVVAIAAGAEQVVNVDMSSSALNWGRRNHQINHLPRYDNYLAENILKSWGRIRKQGPYDMVILDPPSFQKGSFVAEKDYEKLVRRLPELMPDGGLLLACLNAPELPENFLRERVESQLPNAKFMERLEVSEQCPDIDSDSQLKLLVYKLKSIIESAQLSD